MTYHHLTIDEITMIESYVKQGVSVSEISKRMRRARQTIYNVKNFINQGYAAIDYWHRYGQNKGRCGRKKIILTSDEQEYIQGKLSEGWAPDVIIGRKEKLISCGVSTLYRQFSEGVFDISNLPMKGKRKENHYTEKRGKQAFRRSLSDREKSHPQFKAEFGHLEGDTIVGVHHKSAIITLVERLSKVIIAIKPNGRKAIDIENTLDQWFQSFPRNIFQSITFDCGKEFSNWKNISNKNDIHIYFADPGTPSQRALNENSNGLLRKDGLAKDMDFNKVDQHFISSVTSKRNHIPRKSLNYKTPMEVFLSHLNKMNLSSLI